MDERNNDFDFDFMPIGQAIKKAREARGMTREQLADFFEKIDNFFIFRMKTAYYQGFTPSLVTNGVGVCTPPFTKRIFHPKTKNSRNPFIYGHFRLKNILNFFEIHRKMGENLL